ncbi:phage tail spike protein [Glutamicibacter sp. X7]
MFDNRFMFSGEIPLNFPGLNPVALQRITPDTGAFYADSVDPSRMWERIPGGANDGYLAGQWGKQMGLNTVNPATDKGRFELPHFAGLWPTSGKLLMGLWVKQAYTMSFNPLMSTRGGSDPVAYISTASSSQRIRHNVYGAGGASVLDQYETTPWTGTLGFQFVGVLVDYAALTSQMFSVNADTKASWVGPARALSGAPNTASTANLDIFSLQTAGYWTGGTFDEAIVAHPGTSFDLAGFADAMARGLWADGQAAGQEAYFAVSDTSVTALNSRTLNTGAEHVSWTIDPVVQGAPAGTTAHWSSDGGATWTSGATLPSSFTGLLRWSIPLESGEVFTGIEITEPTGPPPTLEPIAAQNMEQGELVNVPLTFTVEGAPRWQVDAPDLVTGQVTNGSLSLAAGFKTGTGLVTVTLYDDLDRSATQTVEVYVNPREYPEPQTPQYAEAPIILWDDALPNAVLADPVAAVVTNEVNGEQFIEFAIPSGHKHAHLIQPERVVQVAGEPYRIRRITDERTGGLVLKQVYAEARFYDLAYAGQIPAQEFRQVAAGDVMMLALQGTGWTLGVANVTTLRTYSIEDTNPLALLRTVQSAHGGDLIFDNKAKKVSLVTKSGRDQGVGFFYGKNLTEAKRVVDTTSLITRIYARNADGLTIASVNGGKDYVEDYSYTTELRVAVYDFKSGTSPFTMLAMANATLANRSKPSYSYEVTVADMSAKTGSDLDRFDAGDFVTVVDSEVGISEKQRIVKLEYDLMRPENSGITLSAKLRELGGGSGEEAGSLETGAGVGTFDLVPFNLLLNGRFDNDRAHWAHFGAEIVPGNGTGDYAVEFSGAGERWIEQTVQPDNRTAYAFSMDVESDGPAGWVPDLAVIAEITYEDGTTETVTLEIT